MDPVAETPAVPRIGKPGQPRPHRQIAALRQTVTRQIRARGRARADKAHLAPKHRPEQRQPGQPGAPHPKGDRPRQHRAATLNVKDETADVSAATPDPQAAGEALPGFRPQKQPDRQHQRCRQRQKQRRGQQVERPLAPIAAQPVRRYRPRLGGRRLQRCDTHSDPPRDAGCARTEDQGKQVSQGLMKPQFL